MKILIISNDLIHAAHLQVLLASLSKDIVYISDCRNNSLLKNALGANNIFNITFVEFVLLEGGQVNAAEVEALTKNTDEGSRVIIMTDTPSGSETPPPLPANHGLLEKPVNFAKLHNTLIKTGIYLKKLNCWEYKQCGREVSGSQSVDLGVCPAALEVRNKGMHNGKNGGRSCWIISGTLCNGETQGSFATKITSCIECDFYQLVAEEEKEAFESIAQTLMSLDHELTKSSVSEGMFRIDDKARITYFNLAAEEMTGYKSQDLLNKPYQLLFGNAGHDHQQQGPISSSLISGEIHRSNDKVLHRSNDQVFPVHLTCAPILEDQIVVGAVVLFKDITAELHIRRQKEKAQQEIHELAATLEERVQQRTTQLNTANQDLLHTLNRLQEAQGQLVESEKMASLGGLVAGVAHEINTPVGIAYTAATHLEQETQQLARLYHGGKMRRKDLEEYTSTCEEATKLLSSNLNRAAALIRSFKQVAIDQSVETMRKFNFRQYLDEVLLSLRPMLKKTKHSITINCDNDIVINSFPGAFSQILTNLITNSVNHAFEEGEAGHISIKFSKSATNWLLRYSDTGKGIKSTDLKRIFEPFFTTNREKGGSGLGMHIVYNLVNQKLNGSITCTSHLDQGTIFNINIPARETIKLA